MGDVIYIDRYRQARRATRPASPTAVQDAAVRPTTFYFDLGSPFTYLAVERVDRVFAELTWEPASDEALQRRDPWSDPLARAAAERRAAALNVPLVWPERPAQGARGAMRAAAHAAECGRAATFVVAAARLAFCGGFDLDDCEVLAEAAAAAGLSLEACLQAARDPRRDGPIEATGRRLLAAGAERLPAFRVGRSILGGEQRLAEAAALARASAGGPGRVPFAG